MSAQAIKKCPVCGKNKVRRLIGTGAGLIFKGSGFYITDYRDQGYKDKAKADSGSGATSDTKSDSKSDTAATPASKESSKSDSAQNKPAAKTEAPAPAKSEPSSSAAKPVEKKKRGEK